MVKSIDDESRSTRFDSLYGATVMTAIRKCHKVRRREMWTHYLTGFFGEIAFLKSEVRCAGCEQLPVLGRYDSGWQVSKAAHISGGRCARLVKRLDPFRISLSRVGRPPAVERLMYDAALLTTRVLGFGVVTKRRSSIGCKSCAVPLTKH